MVPLVELTAEEASSHATSVFIAVGLTFWFSFLSVIFLGKLALEAQGRKCQLNPPSVFMSSNVLAPSTLSFPQSRADINNGINYQRREDLALLNPRKPLPVVLIHHLNLKLLKMKLRRSKPNLQHPSKLPSVKCPPVQNPKILYQVRANSSSGFKI